MHSHILLYNIFYNSANKRAIYGIILHLDGGFIWQTIFLIPLQNNYQIWKKLADYVFSHTAETQYLSITSLAENCDVSEATITRFCRGLGLSGYNAFKLALAQADRTTDLSDSNNSTEPVSSEDSISTICAKVHATNLLSLNESYALYDEECLKQYQFFCVPAVYIVSVREEV